MGISGKLTKEQCGYCIPVDAPIYPPLPYEYKDVQMMIFRYETEPEAAAALLPPQFELGSPPVGVMLFARYPWSTLGPYNEVAQALDCTYKGQEFTYAVRLHVTADTAMAAGREIAGFPKKIGDIQFDIQEAYVSWLERPRGLRLCSGVMKPIQPIPDHLPMTLEFASLRMIPNPMHGAPPALAQLVQTTWTFSSGELWAAVGSCHYTDVSDIDPYHRLPIRRIQERMLFMGRMQVTAASSILQEF